MSITGNYCPAGLMNMRRNFEVDPATVTKLPDRNAWRATCPVCERPDVPVVKQGEKFYFSGHVEDVKLGGVTESGRSYIKKRGRTW